MGGVGAGLPNSVDQWVRRLEGTGVRDWTVDALDANGIECGNRCAMQEVNAHVAEPGLRAARNTIRGNLEKIYTEVIPALLPRGESGRKRFTSDSP